MKVLIIEDEVLAAERLSNLLIQLDSTIVILDSIDSVKSAVSWFEKNDPPDLAFFDIQLADALSFKIFEQVEVKCPIVFTTAYDQYALKAFEVNSIDYLLKPISEKDLKRALAKFKNQQTPPPIDVALLKSLLDEGQSKKHKEQFVIKVGEHLKKVATDDVQIFYSQDRSTYLFSDGQKKYILDYTLDQIEEMVNPHHFFRINRKYVISMAGIVDMISFSNSRLKITMKSFEVDDMIVSRERVAEFKAWLDR